MEEPRMMPFAGFADIARRHFKEFSTLKASIPEQPPFVPPDDPDQSGRSEHDLWIEDTRLTRQRIEECCIVTVLMSCAAVELYINDAGARLLNKHIFDGFFEEWIDRSPTLQKWQLVPRLAAGYRVDTKSRPLRLLLSLIEIRNKLMHPKSKPLDWSLFEEGNEDRLQKVAPNLEEAASQAIEALEELYKESMNWNDQLHSIHHLWGREHPLFEKEHRKLLIAARDAREHQAAKPDVHNSEAFVPPSRVPTEDRESSSPADGASTRER